MFLIKNESLYAERRYLVIHFSYLHKYEFKKYSKKLFAILTDNMAQIAPTGDTKEDAYKTWYKAVKEGLQKTERQIILITSNGIENLIGFFQYYTNKDTFMMEEIQIIADYQGTNNIFRSLYQFVLSNLHPNIIFVEAYANKHNHKSNGILTKMGLSIIGTNKDDSCFHYRGNYHDLLNWYHHMK
jgi:cobalamin biosynthesis Mg chelatase CobN